MTDLRWPSSHSDHPITVPQPHEPGHPSPRLRCGCVHGSEGYRHGCLRIPAYIGKVEIEGDEEAIVGTNMLPYLLVRSPRQSLLIDAIRIIPCVTQEIDVRKRK